MQEFDVKKDLRLSLYEKIIVNEAKKATYTTKTVKPKKPTIKHWAGVKRGLKVTGEGIKMFDLDGLYHAATGVKMVGKQLARAFKERLKKSLG